MKTRPVTQFLKNELRDYLFEKYLDYQICSEADLHYFVSYQLLKFIKRMNSSEKLILLNRCYFKRQKAYPDIVVFRGNAQNHKPWIAIELKEVNRLKTTTAKAEQRLLLKHKKLGCKGTYLLYVARRGNHKAIRGPKRRHAYYFSEIPIILEKKFQKRKIKLTVKDWEKKFKAWKTFDSKKAVGII